MALQIAAKAPTSYKKYFIPKKAGGSRVIHHPSKQTKAVQYALIETFLSKLPVHECAVAYRRGLTSPIRTNARQHAPFSFTVRLDFRDFFPSIKPEDLFLAIQQSDLPPLEATDKEFLTKALFLKYKFADVGLAVGAPSSPAVSNAVVNELDKKIKEIAGRVSAKSAYTRYADDLVFSSNEKGACRRFYNEVDSLVKKTRSPRFAINKNKTLYLSRGTKRAITGITITPDQHISLGRARKRYIRKLVFNFKNKTLDNKSIGYLQGFLAFTLDVEPNFYNRLAIKYGAATMLEILRRRKK